MMIHSAADEMKQEPREISVKAAARYCSVAWKYYSKDESNGTVHCRLCQQNFKFSSNTANMIKHLRVRHRMSIPSAAGGGGGGGERLCADNATETNISSQRLPETHPVYRRTMERFYQISDRRTSKVWNHYTQLSLHRVECNHCKRQLSFHNSTTSLREHLGRRHSIREEAAHPSATAGPHAHVQSSAHASRFGLVSFQHVPPVTVKEERQECEESEPSRSADGATADCLTHSFSSRVCGSKRAELLTSLILEMVVRDLQPLSMVDERGFKLLLSCLEPDYPVPSPSSLGSLLWPRYHLLKQFLQEHLRSGLAPRCLTLCAEYWRSLGGCGDGQLYLSVSGHFVDAQWRQARCLLQTQPVLEVKGHGCFTDALRAVMSDFQLPEDLVFCVVHDRSGTDPDPEHMNLPEGWMPLLCASRALSLCVQEGLCVESVRQALADARAVVLHFQHDGNAAAALNRKADAVSKHSADLVLNDPGRWTTAIDMCQSLLELKWVISSVLEEQKVAANLTDSQWRLLHELVPVLQTVRMAASFLSEGINAPVSALMPCLQGVSRLLGQKMAEVSCPVVRGVMERIRAGMDRRWSLSDEEALLHSPAVLSSFLDPRFKELRFLSPQTRSKLHDRVKELLSLQASGVPSTAELVADMEESVVERPDPAGFELDDDLPIATMESPASCGSADHRITPPPQSMYDILLGEDPTEQMPEIHQQLENYIAEPLCRRSLSPLRWWCSKQHRFPSVARLARKFLSIPATSVSADRAFAGSESPVAQRRAALGAKHLHHILFLHHNTDVVDLLRGGTDTDPRTSAGRQSRDSLYRTLVSYDGKACVSEDES